MAYRNEVFRAMAAEAAAQANDAPDYVTHNMRAVEEAARRARIRANVRRIYQEARAEVRTRGADPYNDLRGIFA